MKRFIVLLAVLSAVLALPGSASSAGQFPFLAPGFTQGVYGTGSDFFGGVAFAPNGDVWVDTCAFGGSPLLRFDHATTAVQHGSTLHPQAAGSPVPSNAGCGLTNHPDGFLYSNTGSGVVQLNASTGAATGVAFGAAGDALGIAVDPQTGNLVYVGSDGTILTAAPGRPSSTFSTVTTGSFVDGIAFDPTGNFLFTANRTLNVVTIIGRNGALVGNSPSIPAVPDGISFHSTAPKFVVTNNNDGSMTRLDFPGDNYAQAPTLSLFASGGFRGDLTQVGPDGCIYLTQDGTRFDDGTTSFGDSVVRMCPGFAPPPGVVTPLNPGTTVCNGVYNGTGKDVTVPAGAVCTLVAGTTVTHDVTVQQGGTLVDQGAAIGHDLAATGAKGLAITGGTVGHDLQISGLAGSPPGGGDNEVCGVAVGHDLVAQNGAAGAGLLDIGDPPDCTAGNQVGHDLVVRGNAGALDISENGTAAQPIGHDLTVQGNRPGGVTVTGNAAGHDVTCTGNSPLAGGGNTAGHANGCAIPVVTPDGEFFDLAGLTVAGDSSYGLSVDGNEAGGAITRVWLEQDGSQLATSSTCASGCASDRTLAATVDTTALSEATHAYAAKASDAAGNVGEADWTVTVDHSAADDQANNDPPDDTVLVPGTDDGLGGGADAYDPLSDTDTACDAYVDLGVADWCSDPNASPARLAAPALTSGDTASTYTGCGLEALFWSVNSSKALMTALNNANVGSTCGDYYFANQGSTGEPECLTGARNNPATWADNFHAAPVFTWHLQSADENWYQAGVHFREAMDSAGCQPGDRWLVNEIPSSWRSILSPGPGKPPLTEAQRKQVRARIVSALRGLYNGGPADPPMKGFTAEVVEGEGVSALGSYRTGLEKAYADTKFWQAVGRYLDGWSAETYNQCAHTCLRLTTSSIADKAVNPYSYYERKLAIAAPSGAVDAAKTTLASTYMPLLNGVWNSPRAVFDSNISLVQMARLIKLQVYSARRAAQVRFGSRGRIGFAWKEAKLTIPDDPAADAAAAKTLAENLAAALKDAYGSGGSPVAVCNDVGGSPFQYGCRPVPETKATLNTAWATFASW